MLLLFIWGSNLTLKLFQTYPYTVLLIISVVQHIFELHIFSLPVRMYKKSYCTTRGVGIGGGGESVDKMLKLSYDMKAVTKHSKLG